MRGQKNIILFISTALILWVFIRHSGSSFGQENQKSNELETFSQEDSISHLLFKKERKEPSNYQGKKNFIRYHGFSFHKYDRKLFLKHKQLKVFCQNLFH